MFFNIIACYGFQNEPYTPYYNKMISEFIKEMKSEYDLVCIGSGGNGGNGGSMHEDIEHISVFFTSNKEATLEAARDIAIQANEKLLAMIENDKNVKNFICKNSDSITSISISFFRKDPSSINQVIITNNKISYLVDKPNTNLRAKLAEESYDQALSAYKSSIKN